MLCIWLVLQDKVEAVVTRQLITKCTVWCQHIRKKFVQRCHKMSVLWGERCGKVVG